MSIYLDDIPLTEAKERFEAALKSIGMWGILGVEELPLDEKVIGRVLAEAVFAKISSPHYHAAAMDGFAVLSANTTGAMPSSPVDLPCERESSSSRAAYVDTGDLLPEWADAVIPIENVESINLNGSIAENIRQPALIRIRSAVTPWSHVRPMGEDIVATQLVLPAGHILRPVDLGAIAACGHHKIFVARKPRVAILPTGSELIPIGTPIHPGEIIEYNSVVLAAQINQWGGVATRYPITPDTFEEIYRCVVQASETCDLILLNAGSSAGSEDYSGKVIEALGEALVHGVAIRPGHPVILGVIGVNEGLKKAIPIIGVPGYPVSAALTGEIFVEPVIAQWLGRSSISYPKVKASITRKVTSPPGDDDYLRVIVGRVGEKVLAAPLSRGSGVITSLVNADGIVILPRGSQGLDAGAEVEVRLYRNSEELDTTIFAIGSHDITLDLMAQFLATHGRRLSSANVGSLGGLIAIRRGETHIAGSHLLDMSSGEYNLSYIRQYLLDKKLVVLDLVGREQGLMVTKGNRKAIRDLNDLIRDDITFVNRQRGAGTRVLLDFNLIKLGMKSEQIRGYEHEEYTHLAVAASIASGRADCGLGIAAAAYALDLDFIPLFQELYQLIIPDEFYLSNLLEPLVDLLHNAEFKRIVGKLPGYDVSRMGSVAFDLRA